MDFDKLILQRESVRKYTDKDISRDSIIKCVEAARLTPSAHNSQPWTFVIVDDKQLVSQVAACTVNKIVKFNKFVKDAKAIAAIVMEKTHFAMIGSNKTDENYNFIDMGAAAEHFCLQAADLGIGTCILGYYDEKKVKSLLNVPGNKRVGLLISMGYSPFESVREKKRKPLNEMCTFNSYMQVKNEEK
ncbi:MAG: nitroreductase family protein [Clostridia bacterium]|nr:nitroreductase family protein [Clostridia bacterium]